jgi:hypothetical protein
MHHRKYILGCLFAAFGFGFLIGMWVEGGFLAHCIGFGMLIFGISQVCKK